MLAVAGPDEKLLVGRDAHKSVISGLILAGIRPIWVEPAWDPDLHLAHPPSAAAFADKLDAHPAARGGWSPARHRMGHARISPLSPRSATPAAARSSPMRRGALTCPFMTGCPPGR